MLLQNGMQSEIAIFGQADRLQRITLSRYRVEVTAT